jgi:non-specific serine/threonine protein kinase
MPTRSADFAELLRRERRALGLTQAELAERARLSERAISDMERGLKMPQRATLRLLTEGLALTSEQQAEFEAAWLNRRQHATPAESAQARTNLPSARTSFVGRERLLADVRRLLSSPASGFRLLTLTGSGGTGKTRLAVEAASGMLEQHADGVYFVDLAPLSDPRLVVPSVAQALGVSLEGRLPLLASLQNYLRTRQLLLILDNFEQVLGAAVDVGELLASCPRLRVLITSRAPLRLLGEQELVVPPLSVPDPASQHLAELAAAESVQLFLHRARSVNPEFALTRESAAAVAEICRRLDGLPLAIELAAARTRLLEPQAMLGPLEHRLQLLTSGARDAPARQQTLRKTIAWSYDLLAPDEQALFRRLAVFVGGCSVSAAQVVCEGDNVLDLLDSLAAKSLLRPLGSYLGEARVGMLETIREFALEQLAWSGELQTRRRRHAEYFLDLAEQTEPGLGGPDVAMLLARLEREHDNMRAALEWNLGEPHAGEAPLRLAGALARFWWLGGHFTEGSRWLGRALATSRAPTPARMKALYGAGWLAHFQRDGAAAQKALEESLAIAEQLNDAWARAWVLHGLGRVAYFDNDPVAARRLAKQSLVLAESIHDRWLIGWALHLLALAAHIANDDGTAHAYYAQSFAIRRELGHVEGTEILLHLRGMLHHRAGQLAEALADYRAALGLALDLNSPFFVRNLLALFAAIAAEMRPETTALLGGAVTLMAESSHTLPIPLTEELFERGVQQARGALGEAAFQAAWARGRTLSMDATLVEAFTVDVATEPPVVRPAGLTPMEVEVLRRVARGCTTREIASELSIAVSTADRHITHIYEKIGQRGRAAAARFAIEHGVT